MSTYVPRDPRSFDNEIKGNRVPEAKTMSRGNKGTSYERTQSHGLWGIVETQVGCDTVISGDPPLTPLQSPSRTLHLYTPDTKGPVLLQRTVDPTAPPRVKVGESMVSAPFPYHWVTFKGQTTLRTRPRGLATGVIKVPTIPISSREHQV